VFNGGSDDTSLITRAVIRYSGSDLGSAIDDGAIFLSNASPQLSYITFTNNYINGVDMDNVSWTTDTWDNTTVIYLIEEGNITIPAANTLTINPGMKIKIRNAAGLNIDGKLVVSGVIDNPVYFSSAKDDTLCGLGAAGETICDTNNNDLSSGVVNDWGNLQFNSGSDDTSTITRAIIRYGGTVRLTSASPAISYTALVNNNRGIEALSDSTPTLVCNDIYSNTSFGIYNDPPTTTIVTAEGHWWGSVLGPTHSGNPGGNGQPVSDGVDYNPWAVQSCTGTEPSNLQASAVSTTQINLTWQDNSSNETEFRIERSPNGSTGWTEIATGGANVTSYNFTGLCSTTYYFRVRGYRQSDGQFSGYSNVASATTYPCKPSNLVATAVSTSQINLTWQDNSPDESEFHIERSLNQSNWTEIATVGANVPGYNDTGLTSGTTYFYRIRAHRHSDGAYSGYSNVASATTFTGPSTCQPPSNLQALAVSVTQVNLTWINNCPNVSNFRVERSPNGNTGWTERAIVGANVPNYSDTGLTSGTVYYYRVRAYRQSDNKYSAYSNVVSAQTLYGVYLPVVLK
jgi:hypothetical protein